MDDSLADILCRLTHFQRRAHHLNPLNSKRKRRLISGISECTRNSHRLKAVLVSTSIDDTILQSIEFIKMRRSAVKLVWTRLTASELANCTGNSGRVIVVGVVSVEGCNQEWCGFMEEYEETMMKSAEEMRTNRIFIEAAKYGIESVFHDIDSFDNDVLLTLVKFGHLSIVSGLLVDCTIVETLKMTAVENQDIEMLKLLQKADDSVSEELLVSAVKGGNTDIVKLLIDSCKSYNHEMVLYTAVCNIKNADSLQFLLKRLNPQLQTVAVHGKTLLVHAMEHDSIECAKVLIKECPRLVQDAAFWSLSERNQNIHNYAQKVLISLGE